MKKRGVVTIISLVLAVCMLLSVVACGTSTVNVDGVEFESSTVSLDVGESKKLNYIIFPAGEEDAEGTWITSDPTVATVDAEGVVTGVGDGKAAIMLMIGDKRATCTVNVTDRDKVFIAPTGVRLNKRAISLDADDTAKSSEQLSITVSPDNASDPTVKWASAFPSIATVDQTGLVKAVGEGTTTVSVTTSNNYSDYCVVTVTGGKVATDNLYVGKVSSLQGREAGTDDAFIMGMDSSELPSLLEAREAQDLKFYDFNGEEKHILQTLKENGITDIRIRVWNDPYDAEDRGYGGGNCDVDNAVALAEMCAQYDLGVIIDFHYSDFWADPGKQRIPKEWEGLDSDAVASKITEFTEGALTRIKAVNEKITMVQVGNETTGGLAGAKDWPTICKYMKAGIEAVRSATGAVAEGGAKVAVHFTNAGSNTYLAHAKTLADNGVQYDVFGTSWYAYYSSHGTLKNLTAQLKEIHDTYGKEVMVLETAYAWTEQDFDGMGNTAIETTTEPITVQGMANAVRDVIKAIADLGDYGLGVCYWGGTWTSATESDSWEINQPIYKQYGCGWATSYAAGYDDDANDGGTQVDNNAFFRPDGTPIEALKVFHYVYTGHTTTLMADYVYDSEVYCTVNEGHIELPTSVDLVLNNGSKQTVTPIWTTEEGALDEYITKASEYKVYGTTPLYGGVCVCTVWVMNENLLSGGSFEESDGFTAYPDNTTKYIQSKLGDWKVTYAGGTEELQLFVSNNMGNARMGTNSFHFWDNGSVSFDLYQTLDVSKLEKFGNGKYGCSFDIQGNDGSNLAIYSYITVKYNDGTEETTVQGTKADLLGWKVWSRTAVTGVELDLSRIESVTVGIHVYAEKKNQGPWGNIDNCQFYFEG